MTRPDFEVRPGVIADAPGMARVHWDSHQSTYVEPGRIRRDLVEAWTLRDRIMVWTTNLAIASGAYPAPEGFRRMVIHVAVAPVDVTSAGAAAGGIGASSERVIGWANTSTGRDPDAPRDVELEGLYVLDEFHGRGVGQALLDAALGARPAYLWALEDNPRAHAFYRRNGFELDGTSKVDALWDATEVRFIR